MSSVAVGSSPEPDSPRTAVIRNFSDTKAVLAMLGADVAVLLVLRTSDTDRRRVLDLLTGWAVGAGGALDRIGPNAVVARPSGTPPVRMSRPGVMSAMEEAFEGDDHPLSRDEERRLLRLASSGSLSARRRLVDAYSELATLLALYLRPRSMPEATAVTIGQQELDRLTVWHPASTPFLVALIEQILTALG